MKGRDLQQDSAAVPTANHQNTQSENTYTRYTARDANVTRHQTRHQNIKHKRPHINRRDQWATGADFGRPSAWLEADGVVIRITCAQPSHSSGCTEVSKNAQLWCKITSSL